MYIGALKFSHSYLNIYVTRVAPLGFFYTCLRSAPALLDNTFCRFSKEEVFQALANPAASICVKF